MGQRYLIDTNPVIDFFNGKLSKEGKEFLSLVEPIISVITQIELLSNKKLPSHELNEIQNFTAVAIIMNLDEKVVQQTIFLRQNHKLKTPDAIIAATALANDLILISRNIADFKNIVGLNIIDLHRL